MSEFALVWQIDDQQLTYILRPRQQVIIGRHEHCDIVLSAPTIARRHVEISHESQYLFLRNLSTSNPINLNGRFRIAFGQRAALKASDRFSIHPVTFSVSDAIALKIRCHRCQNLSEHVPEQFCPHCGTALLHGQAEYVMR